VGEAEKVDLDEFRRNIDAINREDWDAAQTLQHEDMVWHDAPELPDSTAHVGREAIRRYWEEELFDAWERWSLDLRELTPHGDFIFSHCILTAKARHTGLEQSIDLYQVWKAKDGLAIEQWLFFNREQALEAAGIDS
jgi:ketosteroid isomerase-like protein